MIPPVIAEERALLSHVLSSRRRVPRATEGRGVWFVKPLSKREVNHGRSTGGSEVSAILRGVVLVVHTCQGPRNRGFLFADQAQERNPRAHGKFPRETAPRPRASKSLLPEDSPGSGDLPGTLWETLKSGSVVLEKSGFPRAVCEGYARLETTKPITQLSSFQAQSSARSWGELSQSKHTPV